MSQIKYLFFVRNYSSQLLPVPVIKIPKYVERHVAKKKEREMLQKLSVKRRIMYRGNTNVPVISSTNGEFNYYLGQVYNPKYPLPLQSKYWFKTKSSGQKFTIHPYDSNPSLASTSEEEYVDEYIPNEFSKMNLSCKMVGSLDNLFNSSKPTRIQTLAIPQISSGRHVLVATETGSGKTVSYLAPIIDRIATYKKSEKSIFNTPLGLIITPGRELAEQIADVAHKLALDLGVNVKVVMSEGSRIPYLKPDPNNSIDLLVSSIGCLTKLFQKGIFKFGNLKCIVLDEADTLLDDSFIDETSYFLQKQTLRSDISQHCDVAYGAQIICMSSVYPTNIQSIFSHSFKEEDLLKICSPYLHRVQPHVLQQFCRVSNDTRAGELLELVKKEYKKKPLMIFCNKSPTCEWLSKFLESNGVTNVVYHGAVDPFKRSQALQHFYCGLCNVLICTDLGSRGLDTQIVKHVINFDFPNNISDYILRAGRVGRVGTNQGRVTSFIVSVPGVFTVQEIEKAIKQSSIISNVDSNIKRKINKLYF